MLTAVQLKPDVYWVGAIDWNARSFHGYTTEAGITYNAYLIIDEKVTLIDTVKAPFADEMIQRISSVIDPSKIDVIVCNHVEMDHSGSLPAIKKYCPDAPVYVSEPHGVKGFMAHYGDLGYVGVKSGDSINIGKRDLAFVHTIMVHWPDNMVTLSAQDKILFSNDAFGQHFASSGRFDDQNDLPELLRQARKYYANIVQPYRQKAERAVDAVLGLGDAVDMIAPAHGVVWRSHVAEILDLYKRVFTSGALEERALVVYDTMWNSTAKIAGVIADAFLAEGIPVQLMDLKSNHISDAMAVFLDCKYVAVGSPTLNMKMQPTVAGFLNYMRGLSPKNEGRVGIAFGSYGWAPAGPKEVAAELEAAGFAQPLAPLTFNWISTEEFLDEVRAKVGAMIAEARG